MNMLCGQNTWGLMLRQMFGCAYRNQWAAKGYIIPKLRTRVHYVLCKILLAVKNGVFLVVTPCGSCKNRRFGGTWRLLHQGDQNR
jgi:hypothetical protein